MNTINFVQCSFDVSGSDLCAMSDITPIIMDHYGEQLRDAPRDANGDATVEGRYIVITGVDGAYTASELAET